MIVIISVFHISVSYYTRITNKKPKFLLTNRYSSVRIVDMNAEPTKLQVELLQLIAPQPYGRGLKLIQASKLLHLSYRQARYQLEKFRVSYPSRWQIIKDMKSEKKRLAPLHRRLKKSLRNPIRIGAIDWADISHDPTSLKDSNLLFDFGRDEYYNEDSPGLVYLKIKEKF